MIFNATRLRAFDLKDSKTGHINIYNQVKNTDLHINEHHPNIRVAKIDKHRKKSKKEHNK